MGDYNEKILREFTNKDSETYKGTGTGVKLLPHAYNLSSKYNKVPVNSNMMKGLKLAGTAFELHDLLDEETNTAEEYAQEGTDLAFNLAGYVHPVGAVGSAAYSATKLIDKHLLDGAMEDGAYSVIEGIGGKVKEEDDNPLGHYKAEKRAHATSLATRVYNEFNKGLIDKERFINLFSKQIALSGDPSWFLDNFDLPYEIRYEVMTKTMTNLLRQ